MSFRTTLGLTLLALLAFAANSVFARLALGPLHASPVAFTWVRVAAGAACLAVVTRRLPPARNWRRLVAQSLALCVYALPFSLAFVRLTAGTGALIAFSTVQLTMVGGGWLRGERLSKRLVLAFFGATIGIVVLVSPGLTSPDPVAALTMALSGVGWGVFSLLGKSAGPPLAAMNGSFLLATVWLTPLVLAGPGLGGLEGKALLYALLSGAVTSGLGYVAWYRALQSLTAARAALSQLSVPLLAGLGGVVLLGEVLTPRLVIATAIILPSLAVGLAGKLDR